MSSSESIRGYGLHQLHAAATALRSALHTSLGDLLPPYADEVLNDLEELTAQGHAELSKVRTVIDEAASVMEMLASVPDQWQAVKRTAAEAGLIDDSC